MRVKQEGDKDDGEDVVQGLDGQEEPRPDEQALPGEATDGRCRALQSRNLPGPLKIPPHSRSGPWHRPIPPPPPTES